MTVFYTRNTLDHSPLVRSLPGAGNDTDIVCVNEIDRKICFLWESNRWNRINWYNPVIGRLPGPITNLTLSNLTTTVSFGFIDSFSFTLNWQPPTFFGDPVSTRYFVRTFVLPRGNLGLGHAGDDSFTATTGISSRNFNFHPTVDFFAPREVLVEIFLTVGG